MSTSIKDVKREFISLNAHHTNVLKKISKIQSKCDIAGNLVANEIKLGSDAMSVLFQVFRESIDDQNTDKQYWMQKLQNMSKMKDAMRDYLKELNVIAVEVMNSNKNDKNYDEATIIDNTITRLDKMTTAVNSYSSALSSSNDKRKNDAMLQLRQLKSNIVVIKQKLKTKKIATPVKPIDPRKLPKKKRKFP